MEDPIRTIEAMFEPGGALETALPDFESRPGQMRMAAEVARTLWSGHIGVFEAGTGTGKSLAYLVPAADWACRNEKRVAISTHTINLQEQLLQKDIPLAQTALGLPIRATLVKGRSNYLCLRKSQLLQVESAEMTGADHDALKRLLNGLDQLKTGDRAEMPARFSDSAWERLSARGDQCIRGFCPFNHCCYVQKARREAANSQFLIVNHHLLLADVALKGDTSEEGGVLPQYSALIMDEAHHIEDIATEYFGREADTAGWRRLWDMVLRHEGRIPGGALVQLREHVLRVTTEGRKKWLAQIDESIDPVQRTSEQGLAWFGMVAEMVERGGTEEAAGKRMRIRDGFCTQPGFAALAAAYDDLSVVAADATRRLQSVCTSMRGVQEVEHDPETMAALVVLQNCVEQCRETLCVASDILGGPAPGTVAWLETALSGKTSGGRLVERPLSVGETFFERVVAPLQAVIFTSATLATGQNLSYWNARVGLNRAGTEKRREAVISSPFDYQNQLLLVVPTDLPEPDSRDFISRAADYLEQVLVLSRGRAFLLFTSYGMLAQTHRALAGRLAGLGMDVLCQGEADRARLIAQFKESGRAVLFGTSSFWEGVDVPGDALSLVVLAKLPFAVPSDPINEARYEKVEQEGRNPFVELSLPQAVIRFKQGFGRLIRTQGDRGAVVVLDRRIVTRPYGRSFIEALPPSANCTAPWAATLDMLSRWYSHRCEPPRGADPE